MLIASLILWPVVLALAVPLLSGPRLRITRAADLARRNGMYMVTRLPFALLAAGFAAPLLPAELIAAWLGGESGWIGILIASALGILVPSGPIMSFPLALALAKAGVGVPQLVAFLSAWSLFSLTNTLAWDVPILGLRFTLVRVFGSLLLPPLSGFFAALMIGAV
jgi:uncharacterized membrane protein YraQ (UPF0718 family)